MRIAVLISSDAAFGLRLSAAWAEAGDDVSVVLLDEAAAVVRGDHPHAGHVQEAQRAGVSVAVHDDALRRRGVPSAVAERLKVVDLDELADLVADGADKVVWW